jgi:hypothetical protein
VQRLRPLSLTEPGQPRTGSRVGVCHHGTDGAGALRIESHIASISPNNGGALANRSPSPTILASGRPPGASAGPALLMDLVKNRSFIEDHSGKIKQRPNAFKNSFKNRRVQQPPRDRFLRRWAA